MRSVLHHKVLDYEVELTRFGREEPHETREGLYSFSFRYRPEGQRQTYLGVFVPEPLRAEVEAGTVEYFYLEHHVFAEAVSRQMSHHPYRVLWGIRTRDGKVLACVPAKVVRARNLRKYGGWLGTLLGIGLLFTSHGALAALLLAGGTHALRTVSDMPRESSIRSDLESPFV